MVEMETVQVELDSDPRWQLVERIVSTPPFEKATRLQALLRYIVEQTICGAQDQLSESNIGQQVFGKGPDYSPLTDSSVRVQARQLRLKLHEYFDGPGRDESLILEIPKGSYAPSFRAMVQEQVNPGPPIESSAPALHMAEPREQYRFLPWALVAMTGMLCIYLMWDLHRLQARPTAVPWPLASVYDGHEVTRVILADSAFQINSTATGSAASLNDYLHSKPRDEASIHLSDTFESRLEHALNGGTFTSFADVALVSEVSKVAGRYGLDLDIKSARDIDPRDLEQGNFILVGSKSSNPWVTLYETKLNFQEVDNPAHAGSKCFLNRHPQANEPALFEGSSNDEVREDYADIGVVHGIGDHGAVMIVQGLRHEGTEAVGRLLADPDASGLLMHSFQNAGARVPPRYFEALLAIRSIAGIPHVTKVVAIRILQS